MEQDPEEPIPDMNGPPGAAYRLFRSGIERYIGAKIHDWTFENFSSLELQNSKIATIIGVNKALITKWLARRQSVALDNVAPLTYAFTVSIPESERWEKRRLSLRRYLPLPRKLAHAGYLEVREALADGGRGDGHELESEEFWWLFHLLADNKWLKAAADDRKNGAASLYDLPSKCASTRLYHVYSNRLDLIKWHLRAEPKLDFAGVRALFPLWFKPWMYGIAGTAASPKQSKAEKGLAASDNLD